MKESDFKPLFYRVGAVNPDYLEWADGAMRTMAIERGEDEGKVWQDMMAEWMRAIGRYTVEELECVIDQMASGTTDFPKYQALWRELAYRCAQNRSSADQSEREARQLRAVHCQYCQGRGSVQIYNPRFVEWVRARFIDRFERDDWKRVKPLPAPLRDARRKTRLRAGNLVTSFSAAPVAEPADDGWFCEAAHEWYQLVLRKREALPAMIGAFCCCDGYNAQVFAEQYRADAAGEKRRGEPRRCAYGIRYAPLDHTIASGDPRLDLKNRFHLSGGATVRAGHAG